MDILYCHYYLFYTKVIPDDEPHATTIWTLSFSESLLVNYLIDIAGAHLFCRFLMTKWSMLGVFAIILLSNYLAIHRTKNNLRIVKEKPTLFGSRGIAIAVTWLFFLTTSSFLFWVADSVMAVLDRCD